MTPEQKTQTVTPSFGQPRFGRIDADLGDVDAAIVRARDFLLSLQHPDGYWCGELEADSMLEADYIFLHTLLESGDPGRLQRACTEMMRYQNDDGSWSIYPGGPGNISLSVKCYSAAKLMGIPSRRPAPGQVPRVGAGAWRRRGVQHLHQNVSLCTGRVRLRRRARHSAGDCPLSQVVLLQYLRNLLVVAVHPRAAGHHVRQKAVQENPPGAGNRRALRRRPRQLHPASARRSQAPHLLAQFLSGSRPPDALVRGGAHSPAAQTGFEARREVDARAPGDDRRPRRHLSGHAQRHHCAALPGLLRRRSAGDSRARRV